MKFFQRIWKDPVWSNVIATAIFALVATVGAALWGHLSDVKWSAPVTFPTWEVAVWAVMQIAAAAWIGCSLIFGMRPVFRFVPDPERDAARAFSEVALDAPLKLHFEYLGGRDMYPSNGKSFWDGTYLQAFRLVGPHLKAKPAERVVKTRFNKTLSAELKDYAIVHVMPNDFDSMKIRLESLGAIKLVHDQDTLRWELTSDGERLLAKLH
ncbi:MULTISPECIES: hypothetical protein [unclassified Caballeronia]|uniref:hypothetical protein n=1 Tax=unclassified Caballeronia TaxID=2646786 RepID=UPI0028546107|nr:MULTISPECIES: hypothetical protein [unclassified Caballeronia]MDR5751126.1 hypothetical protein [Caballeronia sp. LZ024]MDR5844737.1 hypothetical protein [Caballeronia sp. LZ031]